MLKNNKNFLSVSRLILLIGLFVITACNSSGKEGGQYASIPVGKAYAEGEEIYFSHTEASDAAIADKLTKMIKSPVLFVPSLAKTPEEALAKVFVFENGVNGKGPLGFQADVFNAPPPSEQYSPLRRLSTVKWQEGQSARELKSISDILSAAENKELTIQETEIVINMPFMAWKGGKR